MSALRRSLPVLVAVALVATAVVLLHHELRRYDLHALLLAARAIPAPRLGLALLAAAGSYATLTLYDVRALRHIGHPLGYARTAVASFTSYVASHNLGLSGLGGTAVRFRLYTAFGLSSLEILEVVAFCAAGFWVGFVALAGIVFTLFPLELPPAVHALVPTTRPIGIAFLAASLAFLAWSLRGGREIAFRSLRFRPPETRALLALLPLGLLDWACASAVLWVLLPPEHGIGFGHVFSLFLAAQTLGMLSHVPAGLGVFETVVLFLLPGDVPTPELVGALLAYRAIYYLVPLAAASVTLLVLELSLRRAQLAALRRWVQPIASSLLPRALALTTSLAGAVLLVTGSLPPSGARLAWLERTLPLPAVELSHFLGSLAGAGLLFLGRGLQRRVDAAWWLSALLLACGTVLALVRGLGIEEAVLSALVLALLLPFRRVFHRRSTLLHAPLSSSWLLAAGLVLVSSIWLGLLAHRHVEYSSDLWWRFTWGGSAPRFLRATAGITALLGLLGVARLLKPVPPALAAPGAADLADARRILADQPVTSGHLALLGDKHLLFDEARSAFVMFGIQDTTWIAMGDPVGGKEDVRRELVWSFREMAEDAGGQAVFYQVTEELLGVYAEAGFSLLKIGEEARVDLATFSLEGRASKGLRSARNRLEREGLEFRVLPPVEARAIAAELEEVSLAWLGTRTTGEKGFSLGRFDRDYVTSGPVAVLRRDGRLLAFANVWLGAPGTELSVDLMRHVPEAPAGVMDFLFVQLMAWGRQEGFRWFSLGMAPLAGLTGRSAAPLWSRMAGLLYEHGEALYHFKGLRQYKEKFGPEWSPRYLAAPGGLSIPRVLLDLSVRISGGLRATFAR